MSRGRVTIPTDANFVEGTKKYADKWGADAVRDCDGTELPLNARDIADKVYKTYFLVRGDNEFAYSHPQYLQNFALISERVTALGKTLKIDLLKGLLHEQVSVNTENYKKYWQVYDRTTGKEINAWEYVGDNTVEIYDAETYHEYTVNFFGKNLWDSTQVYNYTCNGWTCEKDRDVDPIYPEVLEHILNNLDTWMKENPDVTVIRFTTFIYHFFLLYNKNAENKLFDWYNYATAASPAMFERFEKEYGYEIKLEDLLTEGYYANQFIIPSKAVKDFTDLVQRFVCEIVAKITKKVHTAGKEAMMFWGDSWIGVEPYGRYFSETGIDAVVGSVSSGVTVRAVSDIPNLKCKEIRLMPYFFPDTLNDDEIATATLKSNWLIERRAILRKPVDRIGFGGYLQLADKLPKFCAATAKLCDEFREIYDVVSKGEPYSHIKVAVMSYYGKEKSWMTNMVSQDAPFQRTAPYLGFLESLAGLPVEISFISFDHAKCGSLKNYDIVFNVGDEGTAFSGAACWKDKKLVECVREYVALGGGFIGIGEPSAVMYGGRFFQLADVMGVDEEKSKSIMFNRYNFKKADKHFILEDMTGELDCAGGTRHVYAFDGTVILDCAYDKDLPCGVNHCHVKAAVNEYGKGRSLYLSGMKYTTENTRFLYRAMLWLSHKENLLKKAFSTNVNTECSYYPAAKKYAVTNNTIYPQNTVFYDINGKAKDLQLLPNEIKWLKEK